MNAAPTNSIRSLRSLAATIGLAFLFALGSGEAQVGGPTGPVVYVVNGGNQTITRYDLATKAYLGVFANTAPATPYGITCDPSGNVYVSYNNNSIHKFGSDGTDLGTFASTGLSNPEFIGIHGGYLYASNYGNGKIRKFAMDGTDLGDFANVDSNGIEGMAWDPAGNLYVADYNGAHAGTIVKVAPDGTNLGVFASDGTGSGLEGLVRDSHGNFYLVNFTFQTIRKFSSTGADLGVIVSGRQFYGLAIDSNDVLYGAELFANAIHNYAANGSDLGNFTTTGLGTPINVAIFDNVADLSVAKLGRPNPVGVGSNITYKITVANAGPKAASNVMLVDPLPAWTSLFSYGAIFGGTLSNVANNVTIRIRSLAVNEVKTITVVARVNVAMVGGDVLTNTVTITSDMVDFNPGDNVASSEVTVRGAPHITTGSSKTFSTRRNNSFILRATGVPAPAWSLPGGPGLQLAVGGPLPSGVTFVNNGDGTATLSGTPAPGTGGNYNLLFTAANGVKPDARQTFILTVNDPR